MVNSGQKWVAGPVDSQSAQHTILPTEPPNFLNQCCRAPRLFFLIKKLKVFLIKSLTNLMGEIFVSAWLIGPYEIAWNDWGNSLSFF